MPSIQLYGSKVKGSAKFGNFVTLMADAKPRTTALLFSTGLLKVWPNEMLLWIDNKKIKFTTRNSTDH
uniref:Uncharacterized protein n=1 Tax=Romanomermis culicivorax TaxID=13658 RepID=A0A915K6Z7_ROMCU